jgi:hypothetical protein
MLFRFTYAVNITGKVNGYQAHSVRTYKETAQVYSGSFINRPITINLVQSY